MKWHITQGITKINKKDRVLKRCKKETVDFVQSKYQKIHD
jgi:hypothetical protein